VRLIIRLGLALVANAIALLIAGAVLDGVHIDVTSFVFAVVIFSVASLILRPILLFVVVRRVRPLLGVFALVSTFIVLLVTDLLSDGLDIDGALDWVLATAIVWLATVVYEIFNLRLQRMALRRLRPGAVEPG
jgi:putative membrane protein